MVISLRPGMEKDRDEVIHKLIDIQYTRNEMDFKRGSFRVRGDVLEVFPAYSGSEAYRIEFFGDEVDRIMEIEALTGEVKAQLEHVAIFPASHYVVPKEKYDAGNGKYPCGNERTGNHFLRVRTSFWRHRESRNGQILMWR